LKSWVKDFYNSPHLTQNQRVGAIGEKALFEALKLNNLKPEINLINENPKEWIKEIGLGIDQLVKVSRRRNGFRRSFETIFVIEVKNLLSSIMTKPFLKNEVLPRFKDLPDQINGIPVKKIDLISGHITAPAKTLAEKEDNEVISYPPIPDPSDLAENIKDLATILRVHGIYNKVSIPIRIIGSFMDEVISMDVFEFFILDFSAFFGVFLALLMLFSLISVGDPIDLFEEIMSLLNYFPFKLG